MQKEVDMKAKFTYLDHNYRPLDERPFPDYEPFGMKDMVDKYSMATRVLYRYSRPYPRPFVIVASRSCPFNCSFCVHGHDRPKYRTRSLENIMGEIKENYEKYHFNILILLDELFAVGKERMGDFCDGIQRGREQFGWRFDWCFQTHANARLDAVALARAKKEGCFNFSYGFESASPTILRSMNKRIKPEQIAKAIQLAHQVGLNFSANILFGDPAETRETFLESLSFYFQHCRAACVFLSYLQPYPGSKVFHDINFPDKKKFYETIGQTQYNMTKMPMEEFNLLMNFTRYIETSWAWPERTTGYAKEEDSNDPIVKAYNMKMYGIKFTCPYCKREGKSRQFFPQINRDTFIGTNCTHCGKRIRVDIKEEN